MPCCILILAVLSPRLALFFMAIFSNVIGRAFDGGWFLPLLGFFLLPWTTLAYVVMWDIGSRGVYGIEWFFVVLAFLVDLGTVGRARQQRDYRGPGSSSGSGTVIDI